MLEFPLKSGLYVEYRGGVPCKYNECLSLHAQLVKCCTLCLKCTIVHHLLGFLFRSHQYTVGEVCSSKIWEFQNRRRAPIQAIPWLPGFLSPITVSGMFLFCCQSIDVCMSWLYVFVDSLGVIVVLGLGLPGILCILISAWQQGILNACRSGPLLGNQITWSP